MPIFNLLGDLIDFRSFSNLWYWIGLAVFWSMNSHWVMGVPFDMIQRAKRHKNPEISALLCQDINALAQINARRICQTLRDAALFLCFITSFFLTILLIFSVYYRFEFAQAVLLLVIWHIPIAGLYIRFALDIESARAQEDQIIPRLIRLRRIIQFIGVNAIFLTALYGMWHNMKSSVLY